MNILYSYLEKPYIKEYLWNTLNNDILTTFQKSALLWFFTLFVMIFHYICNDYLLNYVIILS